MKSESFSVKFRGVRGGYPMPGPSTNRVGGNTTCLEVRVDGHLIVIDAGRCGRHPVAVANAPGDAG